MINIFLKTKLSKIDDIVDTKNLKAGIIYDSDNDVVDKIMYIEKDGMAFDVFDDRAYSLGIRDFFFVDDIVPLDKLVWDFMGKTELNLGELLVVYKRFLNDDKFLMKNLDYFGLKEVEVGYKGKTEIISRTAKYSWIKENDNMDVYYKLLKIINCKKIKRRMTLDEGSKGK